MTKGICTNCNKEFKNVEVHSRYCKNKAMTQDTFSQSPTPQTLAEPIASSHQKVTLKQKITRWLNKGKRPIIINKPDSNFSDEGMNEEQKISNLLKEAPYWTKYKPTGISAKIAKIMNPNVSFASCVFVSEHSQPKVLYLPYEPEKNRLIIPEKGFYIPSQTAPPFFFHEDYCLELIHTPALKDKFNIPAHVIQAKYNAGLMEGTLKSGKELLDEIKKYKMVCYLLGVICLVALVALIGVSYTYDKNYKAIAEQTNNLTNVVNSLRLRP